MRYDPARVDYTTLAKRVGKKSGWFAVPKNEAECGIAEQCFGRRFAAETPSLRADKEPKYYLLKSGYRHVPMTELQAVRSNARIASGAVASLLSPRQRALHETIAEHPEAAWPVAVDVPFTQAWAKAQAVAAGLPR